MNVTIETKALNRALELAASAAERKAKIPILAHVRLAADDGVLSLAGTDLELGIVARVDAAVREGGQICLPAKDLKDLVKSAAKWGGEISITTMEGNAALVTYPTATGESTRRMVGLEALSFPDLPTPAKSLELEALADGSKWQPIGAITGSALCRLIDRTAYAISPEESRFTLNGALLQYRECKARMVATDGHRLVVADDDFECHADKGKAMLPKGAMAAAKRIWGKLPDSRILLSMDESHLFFATPTVLLISRKLTGNFPDYERVLPKDVPSVVTFDRAQMLDTLKRSLKVADERAHAVKLVLNGSAKVETSSVERGEFSESVPAAWDGPEDTVAAYNAEYLIDWLQSIAAPTASLAVKPTNVARKPDLETHEPERKPEWAVRDAGLGTIGDAQALHVIMPMRI